jgi:hypothetical protein
MSSICFVLKGSIFPNSQERTQKQISNIDAMIEKINSDISEKRKKAKEIKEYIKLLSDTKNKIDSKNSSRKRMIESYKNRGSMLLKHIREMEEKLQFFEKAKYTLESNQMTAELAQEISALKNELTKVNMIDTEQIVRDTEDIAETNDAIDDFNRRVSVTLNAVNKDIDIDEDEFDAYLNESEEDDTIQEQIKAPITEEDMMNREDNSIEAEFLENKPKKKKQVTFKEKVVEHSF